MEVSQDTGLSHSEMKTMRNVMGNSSRVAAISRLLELGALRTKYTTMTPESLAKDKDQPINTLLNYEKTEFGHALFLDIGSKTGIFSPE